MTSKFLPLNFEKELEADVDNLIFDIKIDKNELWTPRALFVNGDGDTTAAVFITLVCIPSNGSLEFILDEFSFSGVGLRRTETIAMFGNGDRFYMTARSSHPGKIRILIPVTIETNVPSTTYP